MIATCFSRRSRLLVIAASMVLGLVATASGAGINTAVPVITGWKTIDVPGATYGGTTVWSGNDNGEVVGAYTDSAGLVHAFLRSADGQFTSVDALVAGTWYMALVDVNNAGDAVGFYTLPSGAVHSVLRTADGQVSLIDAPAGAGSGFTMGFGINDRREIVGSYNDTAGNLRGFLREADGTFQTIDPPGVDPASNMTWCKSINASGEIACNYFSNNVALQVFGAFNRSHDGTTTIIHSPSAGTGWFMGSLDGNDRSLSNRGDLAGQYLDFNHMSFGFVRHRNGKYEEFAAPGGGTQTWAGTFPIAINGRGTIVGTVSDQAYILHGIVRAPNGAMAQFDAPVPGSYGTHPYAVSSSNQVIGSYFDATGMSHGFTAQIVVPEQ